MSPRPLSRNVSMQVTLGNIDLKCILKSNPLSIARSHVLESVLCTEKVKRGGSWLSSIFLGKIMMV